MVIMMHGKLCMIRKRDIVAILVLMLAFSACGNKSRQAKPIIYDDQPVNELSEPDTASTSVQEEASMREDKPSVPVSSSSSSSSHSSSSSSYDRSATKGRPPHEPDNMRGFDPASEDDMEDNGMSRYMENNDEEGWD